MKTRRGLSTVIGAVFAIIAITTTIAYVSYSIGMLNNYNQSTFAKNVQLSDINKEKFQITSVTTPGNPPKFNITVANAGSLPINFTKLWVQNTTATATDWTYSYVPSKAFVSPGGVITNIGQSIPLYYKSTASYTIKLVTSRGNNQVFTVNSASAAPLNIQLLAIPPTVNIGFKSELIMVVTNNGSSTLTNVVPNTLTISGLAQCSLGQVSPSSYNTLPPGSTAIFKWDATVTGGTNGQSCTFTASPALQNGYSQSVTATLNVNMVTFSQTNLAANTGILTLNYTSFRFTQASGQYSDTWYQGWNFTAAPNTAFKVNMTNNNSTADFYVSSYSQIFFTRTGAGNTGLIYIVNNVTPGTPYTMTAYCGGTGDWCLRIPAGQTATLYFGSYGKQGREASLASNLGQPDTYMTNMLIYGRFGTSGSPSTQYAQSLPYNAWLGF